MKPLPGDKAEKRCRKGRLMGKGGEGERKKEKKRRRRK
jgi:hypothetical protein